MAVSLNATLGSKRINGSYSREKYFIRTDDQAFPYVPIVEDPVDLNAPFYNVDPERLLNVVPEAGILREPGQVNNAIKTVKFATYYEIALLEDHAGN